MPQESHMLAPTINYGWTRAMRPLRTTGASFHAKCYGASLPNAVHNAVQTLCEFRDFMNRLI